MMRDVFALGSCYPHSHGGAHWRALIRTYYHLRFSRDCVLG